MSRLPLAIGALGTMLALAGCGAPFLAASAAPESGPRKPIPPGVSVQPIGEEIADVYGDSAATIRSACAAMTRGDLRLAAFPAGAPAPKWARRMYSVRGRLAHLVVHTNRTLTSAESAALEDRIAAAEAPIVDRMDDLEAEREFDASATTDPV